VGADVRRGIERCLIVASDSLEIEQINVHVTRSRKRIPRGLVAGVAPDGIWLHTSVLREDSVLLTSTLLEEAAHLKLLQLGAIGGLRSFTGALVQEFFASWYTWHELLAAQPSAAERFGDGPLPPANATPHVGYLLGAFLGAATAGVPGAQQRLDSWLQMADPAVRSAALRLQDVAAASSSPLDLAVSLAERFPRTR
jgi:hypothetical protein